MWVSSSVGEEKYIISAYRMAKKFIFPMNGAAEPKITRVRKVILNIF